jgi:hypothetical protein
LGPIAEYLMADGHWKAPETFGPTVFGPSAAISNAKRVDSRFHHTSLILSVQSACAPVLAPQETNSGNATLRSRSEIELNMRPQTGCS